MGCPRATLTGTPGLSMWARLQQVASARHFLLPGAVPRQLRIISKSFLGAKKGLLGPQVPSVEVCSSLSALPHSTAQVPHDKRGRPHSGCPSQPPAPASPQPPAPGAAPAGAGRTVRRTVFRRKDVLVSHQLLHGAHDEVHVLRRRALHLLAPLVMPAVLPVGQRSVRTPAWPPQLPRKSQAQPD